MYTLMDNAVRAFIFLTIISLTTVQTLTSQEVTYTTTVLYLEDPVGDDNGPGTYVYPTAGDFAQPGIFDLTKFEVEVDESNVLFRVYFVNIGSNRWNGVSGFSFQYIHIYVKTTLEGLGELRRDTFGLNVEIEPGWHFAILANGGWAAQPYPVPQGEYPALWRIDKAVETLAAGKEIYADIRGNVVTINISKDKLPDVENYLNWRFAVFVTSYDGYNASRVRSVVAGQEEWKIGGGDQIAIRAGVEPRVMDLLARTIEDQYSVLTSYNITAKRVAVVPMIELDRMEVTRTRTVVPATTPELTTQTTEPTDRASPSLGGPYFSPANQNTGPSPEVVVVVFIAIASAFIIVAIIIANLLRRRV